ncbi:MAG: hypothetical protein Q7K44_00565 [Candidatus Liptonbacteria bacterium]|nr:hypothetical protein [Candidatus Liptonbacteria bacterium]
MKALKLLLAAVLFVSLGTPALAVITILENGGDKVTMSFEAGKAPDAQLPIRLTKKAVLPTVLLMEEGLKTSLAPNAPNRREMEAAAELLVKAFCKHFAKGCVTTGQDTEAAAIEIKLYYSNKPEKYKLSASARFDVNGRIALGTAVSQVQYFIVKEPSNFISAAAANMAAWFAKNIVLPEQNIVTAQ